MTSINRTDSFVKSNEYTLEVERTVSHVEGWLSHREGRLLYALAKKCPAETSIVEIGSFEGKSAIWLASGSKRGNQIKVYSIDPHRGGTEGTFIRNIMRFGLDDVIRRDAKVS